MIVVDIITHVQIRSMDFSDFESPGKLWTVGGNLPACVGYQLG